MAIYRGPGGAGDATADATNAASVAESFADDAAVSAAAAAVSASGAATAQTAAETAQTAAEAAQAAAETAETNAETAETNAETAQAAAEAAEALALSHAGNAEVFAGNAEQAYLDTIALFGNIDAINAAVTEAENFSIAAEASAGNAETFSLAAEVSAGNAEASATLAEGYATDAFNHAGNAETFSISASNYATIALGHAGNAEAIYDAFDDRYLGSKSSAPATDNDGNALLTGALYWNSSSDSLFIWDGAAWNAAAFDASGAVTSFNTRTGAITLSSTDVTNALTYTPLGSSDIGVSIQAYDANLDSINQDLGTTDSPTFVAMTLSGTSAIKIPTGTNAERPGTPATGQLRFNTEAAGFEGYDGSNWGAIGGSVAIANVSGLQDALDAKIDDTELGVTVQPYDADTAKTDVEQTFTANQTFTEVTDTVHTITDGTGFQIDPANGSIQVVTLGANRTPQATNFADGQVVLLGINDGSARTITWTTIGVNWVKAGGSAAAPALATSGLTWVLLWKVGGVVYGSEVGKP